VRQRTCREDQVGGEVFVTVVVTCRSYATRVSQYRNFRYIPETSKGFSLKQGGHTGCGAHPASFPVVAGVTRSGHDSHHSSEYRMHSISSRALPNRHGSGLDPESAEEHLLLRSLCRFKSSITSHRKLAFYSSPSRRY
jgi:hypothetical protein